MKVSCTSKPNRFLASQIWIGYQNVLPVVASTFYQVIFIEMMYKSFFKSDSLSSSKQKVEWFLIILKTPLPIAEII